MSEDATVVFGFDGSKLNAGLDASEQKMKKFGDKTESRFRKLHGVMEKNFGQFVPFLGIAGVIGGIRSFTNSMDDLADTALRLGESTEEIQKVEYASKIMAGVDIHGLTSEFLKLEKALGDVENDKAAEALEHLGITGEKLTRMKLSEKVLALSDAFQKAREKGTGYNDIVTLLGKSAGELIPMLSQGREAIESMFGDAPIISDEQVQKMAEINDKIDGFYAKIKSGAAKAIPVIDDIAMSLGEDAALAGLFFQSLLDTGSVKDAWNFVGQVDQLRNDLAETEAKEAKAAKESAEAARQKIKDLAAEALASEKAKKAADELANSYKRQATEQAAMMKNRQNIEAEKSHTDILEAQSKGQDRKVKKMQDEEFIRQRSADLQGKGMDPNRAIAEAKRELKARKDLEEFEKTGRARIGGVKKKKNFHGGDYYTENDSNLNQFHRNQEKQENRMWDAPLPGYGRGKATPKYDAFGRDGVPPTSAQRGGRYMGGGMYQKPRTYDDMVARNAKAHLAANSNDVSTKIDTSNTHLQKIAEALV